MDIYASADWHSRATNPENRIDNYVEAQYKKIEFLIDHYTNNVHAAGLLIGGDVFDKHDVPDHVKERMIRVLGGTSGFCEPWIGAVFGQHDQRYHTSDKKNTPLGVIAAGVRNFHLLGSDIPLSLSIQPTEAPVHIYGASWGEAIPDPVCDEITINILVIHRMITENGPLWPGHTDYITALEFLKTYPKYHYVISGDNHKPFMFNYRMRYVLNCGSLMRSSIDQVDYSPGFYIIHTEERRVERVPFPFEPATKVFDLKGVQNTKEKDFVLNLIEKYKQSGVKEVLCGHSHSSNLEFLSSHKNVCVDLNNFTPIFLYSE